MNTAQPCRWALWCTIPVAVLLSATSLGGLFLPATYQHETPLHAALYTGNDAGNLVLLVPVLLVSAVMARRGSMAARMVWLGTLVYLVYDFLGYALGVHVNSMFLPYCGIVGLSFYALGGDILALPVPEAARRLSAHIPVKSAASVLLLIGAATILHWLGEMFSVSGVDRITQAVQDSGHLTEPVIVLDICFTAPACLTAGTLLLRRKPAGFALGPIMLAFLALSSVVLVPMGMMMAWRDFAGGSVLCAVGLGIAAIATVPLALSFRGDKAASTGLGGSERSA